MDVSEIKHIFFPFLFSFCGPQDDVKEPSKKLRDMGVTIFSLGLGSEFQRDQLGQMATDPDSKHVLTGGYDELDQMLPKLKKICCEGDYVGS